MTTLTEYQLQTLKELRELGGTGWAKRIEICDMKYSKVVDDKVLDLEERECCIVGEVRNQCNYTAYRRLGFQHIHCYGCGDCSKYSEKLFLHLIGNNFIKTDYWWEQLRAFINHVKEEHKR